MPVPAFATPTASSVRLAVRVVPRASSSEIAGSRDGRLLVRVTAPPVDSAANEAVIAVLAKALGVPRRAVTIVSGQTSKNKVVDVVGAGAAHAAALDQR